ncbi:MAG: tetratricopeptide repeat protein, partial [Bacteroidia bacterium]
VNELMNNPFLKIENGQYVAFSAGEKLATILYTWLRYLQLLVIPHPLTSDYYPYHIPMQTFASPSVLLSLLIHLGATCFALFGLIKQKYSPLVFGILFYLLTFSLVSNLVFPIGTAMGERFMFMPSIGAMCLLVFGIHQLFSTQIMPKLAIVGLICMLFLGKTINRNAAWYDNMTLFQTDVKTSENSAKINNGLAGMLMENVYKQGTSEQEKMNFASQALPYFEKAIQIHPNFTNAWLLKGDAHYYRKEYDAVLTCYQEVKRQNPKQANIATLLGTVYAAKGRVQGEQKGDVKGAIDLFEQALTYDANNEEALRLLGIAFGQQQQFEKAAGYFERYQKVTVNKAWGLYYLGSIYKDLGKIAQGDSLLKAAYDLDASLRKK